MWIFHSGQDNQDYYNPLLCTYQNCMCASTYSRPGNKLLHTTWYLYSDPHIVPHHKGCLYSLVNYNHIRIHICHHHSVHYGTMILPDTDPHHTRPLRMDRHNKYQNLALSNIYIFRIFPRVNINHIAVICRGRIDS